MDEVVLPALAEGKIVLSDRGQDSSTVYQGICRGFGKKLVKDLNAFATGYHLPDLTFVLDIDEKVGRNRVKQRLMRDAKLAGIRRRVKLDRLEREKLDFHKKVRKGFLQLAKEEPKRFRVLNAADDVLNIQRQIEAMMISVLVRRKLWQSK